MKVTEGAPAGKKVRRKPLLVARIAVYPLALMVRSASFLIENRRWKMAAESVIRRGSDEDLRRAP